MATDPSPAEVDPSTVVGPPWVRAAAVVPLEVEAVVVVKDDDEFATAVDADCWIELATESRRINQELVRYPVPYRWSCTG